MIEEMKRHSLDKLLFFEKMYARIEAEARVNDDPRVDNPGGVAEQLEAIRHAIYEKRVEDGIPIPPATVNVDTLTMKAERGDSHG